MNYSHDELSLARISIRDLQNLLGKIAEFDLRFSLTNSHGRSTPFERALAYDVEFARNIARGLDSALAEVNDLTFDRIRTLGMDLGKAVDNARGSGRGLGCSIDSLERACALASGINGAIDRVQRRESGAAALADVNAMAWPIDRGNVKSRDASEQSLEKINRPPVYAEHCLRLLVPPNCAEAVLGDFLERFNLTLTKRGVHLAQLDYCWQVLRSVPGFLQMQLR